MFIILYTHTQCIHEHLIYHFPTCYAYSVKEPIGELNLKRALDEDTYMYVYIYPNLYDYMPILFLSPFLEPYELIILFILYYIRLP